MPEDGQPARGTRYFQVETPNTEVLKSSAQTTLDYELARRVFWRVLLRRARALGYKGEPAVSPLRGLNLSPKVSQGFRPGLSYAAPVGATVCRKGRTTKR